MNYRSEQKGIVISTNQHPLPLSEAAKTLLHPIYIGHGVDRLQLGWALMQLAE